MLTLVPKLTLEPKLKLLPKVDTHTKVDTCTKCLHSLSTRGWLKDVMRTSSITNVMSSRRHLLGVEDVRSSIL